MGQPFADIQQGLYAGLQRFERPFCQRLFSMSCKGRRQRNENANRKDQIRRQAMKILVYGAAYPVWQALEAEAGRYLR